MSVEDERGEPRRPRQPKPTTGRGEPGAVIDHPLHYNSHPSGIECCEVARHMNFNLGNVVKYLWRFGKKGPSLEDLRKAAWYLKDEIERLEKELTGGNGGGSGKTG